MGEAIALLKPVNGSIADGDWSSWARADFKWRHWPTNKS